jgi:tRNA-splicing ligase RtcB (3'-phosphate/5'-hydroxy nucleic acid ligase)
LAIELDTQPKGGPFTFALKGETKAFVTSWLPYDEFEVDTLTQVRNIANLPNAIAVAVMPDAHKGYGMPIGTALATEGAVVPYAVGVDIGCGMVAVPLNLTASELAPSLCQVLEGVYKRVPVGQPTKKDRNQGSFTTRQNSEALREWVNSNTLLSERDALRERADRQLGTLGGGNHFIELQADEQDNVWLMLHTGSRGFGYAIGQAYYKRALEWCTRYHTPLPDKELAFLSLDTEDGQAYMRDMRFAMRFAEESRKRIEETVYDTLSEAALYDVWDYARRIETHHNFAAFEQHFGKKVIVHRKGAVKTVDGPYEGDRLDVTIPGSMQTGSYIGIGKANKLAMNTCSHGAGRTMGRNAVRKANPGVNIRADMAEQGIVLVCPPDSDVLDEAGRAYKDIENVMKYQADLVEPFAKLRPLGVVKG